MHYYLTLGREFLTNRDAKRAKAQLEVGENSIWKPDFNKGQMLPAVLLLESLNLLQFLTPGEHLRGSDEAMQELKKAAMENRYLIKTCLNVTISDKLTPVAIAQKLLDKIDLKLDYVGRGASTFGRNTGRLEIAATQTKSAFADSPKPAKAGLVCIAPDF